MAGPATWTLASVLVVSLVSLIGALTLTFGALSNHRVQVFLIALAAGTLLGDAFLHILPEAAAHGFGARLGGTILLGFLALFLLEVVLRRGHSHGEHHHDDEHLHPFGILNLVGDFVHNFLDGVILAAAFLVDIGLGLATTIAVVLHEVPQELGDFAILVRSGFTPAKALALNLASALAAVVGALLVLLLDVAVADLEAVALPLVAGAFIYIAAADLVPELHHHGTGRTMWVILVGLVAGLLIMAGLGAIEPAIFGTAPGAGDGHAH